MNNTILLKSPGTLFEPHIFTHRELPFIIHPEAASNRERGNIHENLEILYITSGTGRVLYDGHTLAVTEGDTVVINAYVDHHILSDDRLRFSCLIVDNSFCRQNHIDAGGLLFRPLIHDSAVTEGFGRIIREYGDRSPFRNAALRSAVLSLLVLLCRQYSSPRDGQPTINKEALRYMSRAIDYIKGHIGQRITADEVAAHVGLSKFYFLREFKKNTGYTLIEYINIIRCEHAVTLLKSGRYSVKETALLCGFENHSYFANVFKKYTAALPSEVLREARR